MVHIWSCFLAKMLDIGFILSDFYGVLKMFHLSGT